MQNTDLLPILINQLEGGRTLNTLGFLHQDGLQYENGALFSSTRAEALRIHREFRSRVSDFSAQVLASRIEGDTAYLHVQYQFRDADDKPCDLPGVHVQHWRGTMIEREDFWVEAKYEEMRREFFPA